MMIIFNKQNLDNSTETREGQQKHTDELKRDTYTVLVLDTSVVFEDTA